MDHVAWQEAAKNCAAQPKNGEGAENGDRSAEQDAEWKRPAFVQGGEDQEHKQQGEAEDSSGGHSFLRFLFLKRHAYVIEAHLARHGLRKGFFNRSHRLAGGVSGCGSAVDLRGAVFVIAHGEFRTRAGLKARNCGERHHLATIVFDEELTDIFGPCAVIAFGFNVDLPLPAETVEIVDEQAAHEGLKRFVDVVYRNTLLDDFV